MTMKYDLSTIGSGSNDIFTNTFAEVSNATLGLLGVSILLVVFVVLFGVFMKRTQDIGKSGLTSLHICVVIGLVLYYWGYSANFVGVPDAIMLLLVVLDVGMVAFMKYNRRDSI